MHVKQTKSKHGKSNKFRILALKMSRLLIIGDSNIYRNMTASVLSKKLNRPSNILHATRQQTLEVAVQSVTPECEVLIVSALANLLCDEFGQQAPDEAQLSSSVTKYVDLISTAPAVRTLLLPPFFRLEPTWFGPNLPKMRLFMAKSSLRYKHVTVMPEFNVSQLDLLKDGVHLGSDTGAKLLSYIVSCVLDLQEVPTTVATANPAHTDDQSAPESISDVMKLLRKEVLPLLSDVPSNKKKVNFYKH